MRAAGSRCAEARGEDRQAEEEAQRRGGHLTWAGDAAGILDGMEAAAKQISVRLDGEHARKLAELAAERHVEEVELAGEVLAGALDDFGMDGARMTEILDSIPGAWERTQEGLEQARRGEGDAAQRPDLSDPGHHHPGRPG